MRKTILILLILAAIPLYSWNAFTVIRFVMTGSKGGPATKPSMVSPLAAQDLILTARPVSFTEGEKSPFVPFKRKPEPVQPRQQPRKPQPKKVIAPEEPPPKITITGIMWNPDNPIAMLTLPAGNSVVAKSGSEFGDITIKKVERNRVQFLWKGKTYWVDKGG